MRNKRVPTTMNRLPPVSSLMSPPEAKPFDSFNPAPSPCRSQDALFNQDNTLPPISADRKRNQSEMMDLPSPPVTPYVGHKKRRESKEDSVDRDDVATVSNNNSSSSNHNQHHGHHQDPVLFPRTDEIAPPSLQEEPLFAPDLAPSAEALVDKYMSSHLPQLQTKVHKPTRDEYLLALSCVPVVATNYNRNPGAWAMQERKLLDRQFSMMTRHHPAAANTKLKKIAPAPRRNNGGVAAGTRTQRAAARTRRTPKTTPRSKPRDSFDSGVQPAPRATPKPTRVIGANRDETNFRSLPDYSPPIAAIKGNIKGLKADWKGQMLDLSNDPDRDELDPAEINLAATLRLSCASYLSSKRRIFDARVQALRIGKEFRKTDAQQACKIDVNKASKLWSAYEKVGWLDKKLFQEFVKRD